MMAFIEQEANEKAEEIDAKVKITRCGGRYKPGSMFLSLFLGFWTFVPSLVIQQWRDDGEIGNDV